MTLLEIRRKFIDLSGRFDLVVDTTNYVDNGANYFIQAGQRYLDLAQPVDKHMMPLMKNIDSGKHIVNIPNLRFVREVWWVDDDGKRARLEKKDLSWMRANYPSQLSDIDTGSPAYWALAMIGLAPSQKALKSTDYTSEFTYDYEDIMFSDEGDHWLYDGVIIMPPPDTASQIEVLASFWSVLEADTDKSFWSVRYPELSVLAAIYCLEKFYRNSAGVADAKNAMADILAGIDYDMVEGEIVEAPDMEG